jgi:hypothetical protein
MNETNSNAVAMQADLFRIAKGAYECVYDCVYDCVLVHMSAYASVLCVNSILATVLGHQLHQSVGSIE